MTRARDLSNIGPSNQLGFKNFIINGNFDIWQRGTSFGTTALYNADRWWQPSGGTFSYSRGNTNPLAGSLYYISLSSTTAPSALQQAIESSTVTKLAGQTVTLSYWIRSTTTTVPTTTVTYSTSTDALASQTTSISVTTSPGTALVANTWTKQTVTFAVPSSAVGLRISLAGASGSCTVDYSQVQLELGSVATPFENRQYGQELALCQRYYYRLVGGSLYSVFGRAQVITATTANAYINLPVPMRTIPSAALETTGTASNYGITLSNGNVQALTSIPAISGNSNTTEIVGVSLTSTTGGMTAGNGVTFCANNLSTAYIGISAEL